jgi:hypothetical protein
MDYLVLGNFLLDKTSRSGDFSRGCGTDPKTTKIRKSPLLEAELQKPDCSVPALRRFGFTVGAVLVSLGGFMLWRHRTAGWPLLSLALLLLATAIVAPASLRFVYRPWMMLALMLGSIASRVVLTLAFFFVLTPVGLLQWLFGKRALEFDLVRGDASYWKTRARAPVSEEYERQF